MSDETKPTLTDAKGSGGMVAQSGFDYQLWETLSRLPGWLLQPAFEAFILEGLEDFEARFFTPYASHGHIVDRFQAKEGKLSKKALQEVLGNFLIYEQAFPGTARVQTLVTPSLLDRLQWIARDQTRIQRARPFYTPFATVTAASDLKFRNDLMAEFGPPLGSFVAENVDFTLRQYTDVQSARLVFAQALEAAFPALDLTQKQVRAAFDDLVTLANERRGAEITRAQILRVLRGALGDLILDEEPLQVHIRSDRDLPQPQAIEIDASAFAGGEAGFPAPEEWAALTTPMRMVAQWAYQRGHRRIRLTGSYRLSTAFAVGTAFPSAQGFDLDFSVRGHGWRTDDYAQQDGGALGWQSRPATGLVNGRLVVAVGVLRNPVQAVVTTLGLPDARGVLHVQLDRAIVDAQEVQASVNYIKTKVGEAVSAFQPDALDVFLVGPAALALALGHRWNALPSTQWYEFQAGPGMYQRTYRVN